MKRSLHSVLAPASVLAAALFGAPAHALSCDEIMNMVNVKVPTNIVVQTMKDSGESFASADIKCLVESGAPSDVVAAAKSMSQAAAEPAPTAKPEPAKAPKPTMSDDKDDIGGRTSTRKPTSTASEPEDLPERGEVSGGPVPEEVKTAINLIEAKKPLSGSQLLYNALSAGSFPEQELTIRFYLAQSLSDLEMYSSAQVHYTWVVRSIIAAGDLNNEYFAPALARLVAISRLSGDNSELIRLLPKLTPEQYPRGAQNQLYYLVGLRLYEEEQLSEARKFFGQVGPKSDLYLRSKYMEGVIFNKQDKLKSAVKSFRDVYREPVTGINDPTELEEAQNLKDLALINIARIYYGIERYGEASKYYELVNRDSKHWASSLFENAWAKFMQNDLNVSLGLLLTVNSPFFSADEFTPESTVLRSLTFFNLCEYKQVEGELLAFEDKYRPIQAEMRDFVKSYSTEEGKAAADMAWDAYFGKGSKKETKLPKSFFNRALLNQDLASVVKRLDMIDQEEALIDKQNARWRDSLGSALKDQLEKDRQRLKRRAGLLLLSEMARTANYLNDLLTQSEIIRFEVVDAQRVDYGYKMQNPGALNTYQATAVDFATSVDFIYWPFNGEFWKDELGYYRYTEQANCK